MYRTLLFVLALTVLATHVSAQDITSAQPRSTDRVVVVTRTAPDPIEGYLLRLGPDTLMLKTRESAIAVPFDDVLRIDARKDGVRNGAIIGGLIMGGLCALSCGQGLDGGFLLYAVSINTIFGAAIGAGIDASIAGRTPIYRQPPASSAQSGRRLAIAKRLRF